MLVAIKNIVDEAVDDGRLADRLITQKYYFVFEKRWDGSLGEI